MPGPRDYTRATVMALAHYSGGLCYCPGCPEPVLRVVEDKVHLIVQIAHIRGAFPGSCRYEASMTDDQRRDLPNLMLLCDPHHQQADSKEREKTYTREVLERWKAQREADPQAALQRLREVTPAALRDIVADGLKQHDTRLLGAIERLEASDREAAILMRGLVDELAEAYSRMRQGLPAEVMEMFAMAVNSMPSGSVMEEFAMAVGTLDRLKGTLSGFTEAAYHTRD
jgi:hypothetical protein